MAYYPTRYFPTRYYAPRYYPATAATVAATFRAALVAALKADADVSAIVGAKVFPLKQPQTQPVPAILYRVYDRPEHNVVGANGVSRAEASFTIQASTLAECEAIARGVFDLLDGYSGTIPGSSIEALDILCDSERDDDVPAITASDMGTYRTTVDYIIRYRKSKPAR